MRVARKGAACDKLRMDEEGPAQLAQSAALIARAALIIACVALAVAILGLFLPL